MAPNHEKTERKTEDQDEYITRFIALAQRMEGWLIRLIAAAVLLLVLAQAMLTQEELRYRISKVDQAEGVPVQAELRDRQ